MRLKIVQILKGPPTEEPNEYPPVIVSQDGKLPAAVLKWNLHAQREYQF